jgi:hypothetical protein
MSELDENYAVNQPVAVFDQLVVKAGMRQAVIALFESDYIPLARERGLHYLGHYCLPVINTGNSPANLLFQWQYSTVESLWTARGVEENDQRLPDFWLRLAPMLESRSRQLGRPIHFDTLAAAGAEPQKQLPAQNAQYRRWVAFVKPAKVLDKKLCLQCAADIDQLSAPEAIEFSSAGINAGSYTYRESEITWDLLLEKNATPDQYSNLLPEGAILDEYIGLGECIAWGSSTADLSRGVKRTILFDLHAHVLADEVKQLEQVLAQWAQQLKQIANWSLSKVHSASGAIQWTHCFEQEFTDPEAILNDYLNHPFHWSVADRYFHAEAPEAVANQFFHSVRPISTSIIRPAHKKLL